MDKISKMNACIKVMKDNNITAYSVAKELNINCASVSKMLKGQVKKPHDTFIHKLYNHLCVPLYNDISLQTQFKPNTCVYLGKEMSFFEVAHALDKRTAELETQNELVRTLDTPLGFFKAYFDMVSNYPSNEMAFDVVNNMYKDIHGVFKYASYEDFRGGWQSPGYVTKKPEPQTPAAPATLTTAQYKKLPAAQKLFARMKRAVALLERFYACGYDDDFKIQNAVLAVHPGAHPVDILCYCDLCFVSWEMADVMENALNVLKPGA